MHRLPTVLLRHETPTGSHYDWLLADPRAEADAESKRGRLRAAGHAGPAEENAQPDEPRLWAARVQHHSRDWARLRSFELTPLPPHRRIYLRYEGPLSPAADGSPRGNVTRVDEGTATAITWHAERIIVDVAMRHYTGRLELRRVSEMLWRATPLGNAGGTASCGNGCCGRS